MRMPDGDTVVSGLPTSGVTYTLSQYATLVTGSTIVGFVLVGAGGLWLVRRNLAPLERVAHTAQWVSTLQLDSGTVALAQRVPQSDTDPRTEVGQVGLALNNLLLLVDVMILPETPLALARGVAALAGLAPLLFGLVWES